VAAFGEWTVMGWERVSPAGCELVKSAVVDMIAVVIFRTEGMMRKVAGCVGMAVLLVAGRGWGQEAAGPQTDSSVIDGNGTAHITRVIPVPDTVSPEAKQVMGRVVSDAPRN
jgi:hypothetical protein